MSTDGLRLNRRAVLGAAGLGFGGLALNALLAAEAQGATGSPLQPKRPQLPARATSCIFILLEGGPSHIDTFDPKPRLRELHMTEFTRERTKFMSQMETGKRYYVGSPFEFIRAGKSGMEVCEHFPSLAQCVDDLCFYRGAQAESVNHPTALYHLNTGNQFGTDPSLGAWCAYGLGTLNQNLPAFVVLPDEMYPQGGPANWSNGFFPPHYQGTPFRSAGSPILDLAPPAAVTRQTQRRNLDLLAKLNTEHATRRPDHAELAARMDTYELAFRMQAEIPDLANLEREPPVIKELYGIGQRESDSFGRRCLLARRLVEKGVRFVQLYSSGWDSHDDLATAHGARMRAVDRPIAGLLRDLKQRGLLDETLVVCCGEFGRSPDNGVRRNSKVWGRDHNPAAMTLWLAGGGVKAGAIVGATDETGQRAIELAHPLRDVHATLMHLMGLDDNRLRFFHAGRNKQLSQVGAQVIQEILA